MITSFLATSRIWGKDFLVRERGTFAVCMQADERGLVRERSLVRATETYARRHAPHPFRWDA